MATEKDRVDSYLATVGRLEPEITMIDHDAGIASIAISLKRIADAMEKLVSPAADGWSLMDVAGIVRAHD